MLSEPGRDLAAVALHRGLEILITEGKCSINDAREVLGLKPFRFVTAAGSPWVPLDPDGLPPATYPSWRAQEQARKERA